MTRLTCTSDWHGTLPDNLPEGDILVIAGDNMPVWNHGKKFQEEWTKEVFIPFLQTLDFKDIVLIAGNHDFAYEGNKKLKNLFNRNLHFLQDEATTIQGINFYGTPWVPVLARWAFYATDAELELKMEWIPENCDVLLSHGPPFGARDKTCPMFGSVNAGSKSLRKRIVDIKPTLVVTGHIHEGYGRDMIGKTTVVNTSHMNEHYEPKNDAISIDLT